VGGDYFFGLTWCEVSYFFGPAWCGVLLPFPAGFDLFAEGVEEFIAFFFADAADGGRAADDILKVFFGATGEVGVGGADCVEDGMVEEHDAAVVDAHKISIVAQHELIDVELERRPAGVTVVG